MPAALSDVRSPWGDGWSAEEVVAKLEPLVGEPRRNRLEEVIAARLSSVTVLLDAPYDPHNVAAIMRSCDAFGVQQLHVAARERLLLSRKIARGTQWWVDVVVHDSPSDAAHDLQSGGFELVAAETGGSLMPSDLARVGRLALVLGNEHEGVGPEIRATVSRTVKIPMRGFVESLNLSVSAAILLEAATRDRPGDLAATERRDLYARGLFRSVPRAADVLIASRKR